MSFIAPKPPKLVTPTIPDVLQEPVTPVVLPDEGDTRKKAAARQARARTGSGFLDTLLSAGSGTSDTLGG